MNALIITSLQKNIYHFIKKHNPRVMYRFLAIDHYPPIYFTIKRKHIDGICPLFILEKKVYTS